MAFSWRCHFGLFILSLIILLSFSEIHRGELSDERLWELMPKICENYLLPHTSIFSEIQFMAFLLIAVPHHAAKQSLKKVLDQVPRYVT